MSINIFGLVCEYSGAKASPYLSKKKNQNKNFNVPLTERFKLSSQPK
jgi:hypothetical protein